MNYSRIALFGGFAAAALLAGCSASSGKPGGKDWTHWTCDSKAVIEWRYIDGSKNIVDLRLKDEDDVVHHLEQEPAAVGAFYSDGRLGFHLENDEGLVYRVETDDLIGRGCKAR
ncbi:TPA: MliC family protein [Pseudomonas aeruginosa]